ncbi:MAG: class I tRNA ligase family protein [Gemmataceae bacterium]|nr:class I tRNA ligase family protein [Gemmataceae bacterium]
MADAVPHSPFARVETQNVDFPALERAILQFWDEKDIFERRKARNAGRPRWSFLDGPITANNPMGVHHAWGRTYKDAYNRYFAMAGRDLRYQQGFDCQGLWVEVEVEKELKAEGKKLDAKRDIENLVPGDEPASIDYFVQRCKDRVDKYARVQTDQSIRLGYWMNWDRGDADWAERPDERKSYFTMSEGNNYTIWSFLKKCHHKGLIYRGYDVMPWCGRCGVGLSEMEMKEGYKLVGHKAAFVKLPLRDRPGENLLVWTTTPWTLTSNVGAAVNPDLTYLKVRLKDEVYYVAKGAFKLNRMEGGGDEDEPTPAAKKKTRDWLDGVPHLPSIEQHFKSKAGKGASYEVVGEVKGADLLGLAYRGPFDGLPAQNHEYGFPEEVAKVTRQGGQWPAVTAAAAHKVIDGGKDVTETEGTGIVHTAPGCGQIDYGWGRANGLPPVAPIDDAGTFVDGFGPLEGMNAADPATAEVVFEELKKADRLFATERYVHRYPHCWRCKTELLYRLVDEWFINMGPRNTEEGFRGDIMKVVDRVTFLPESLNGRARERDWLWNMGDWMVSKKRFWGLTLPIWVDDQDPTDFEVIGSREELKERAVEGWEEFDGHTPHRPWVDKVKIKNPRTGNLMSRIPDVGNPWLDAGIVAYSTMPADWRPADFITESFPGQFRNWFYALLAMSTMMSDGQEPPFKTLLGHGLVKDQFGKDMHKSEGNSIEFVAAADTGGTVRDAKGNPQPFAAIGADVMRWLYCRQNPAGNVNFGPDPADEVRARFILKLWNCYGFFCNYAALDGFDPGLPQVPACERADIDRWLLSDLQLLIKTARAAFERYDVMAFCLAAEEFVDAKLSNWYVRRNRDRFWSKTAELDEAGRRDKRAAYQTLHTVLLDLCRLCAPVIPFLTEVMWRNLRAGAGAESVHLTDYPAADEELVDAGLSEEMEAARGVVSLGLTARNAAGVNVRRPLAGLRVRPAGDAGRRAVDRFAALIADELNVKQVSLAEEPLLRRSAALNPKTAKARFKGKPEPAAAALAGMDPEAVAADLAAGMFALLGVPLTADDVILTEAAPGGWAGASDKGTQVAIDTRITPELRAEGLARDVVRFVQNARKDAGLDVADRIELFLGTDAELRAAIDAHWPTIAAETQAVRRLDAPPADGFTAAVAVDGRPLTIALRKV